jgi:hypothetical protein
MVDKRNGRDFDPALKSYLNERRTAAKLSLNQVNEYLGVATNGGGVASALMGDKPFNEIPTADTYKKLKTLLKLDNRFDDLIEREEAKREVIGKNPNGFGKNSGASLTHSLEAHPDLTAPATDAAKALDGSYGGFQPKPAVEVVIVAMKPLSEKTFVDQALKNGKGITWLDDCRVPSDSPIASHHGTGGGAGHTTGVFNDNYKTGDAGQFTQTSGRFPANLLVSDDVLNDGRIQKSNNQKTQGRQMDGALFGKRVDGIHHGDSGSYSPLLRPRRMGQDPAFHYHSEGVEV